MKYALLIFFIFFYTSCRLSEHNTDTDSIEDNSKKNQNPYLVVLGNVQDAGYPQIGCMKACCKEHWSPEAKKKMITCLGLVDPVSNQSWLFEASPDFKYQTKKLSDFHNRNEFKLPDGIFLTHAHIGHYVGLMHLGRESMNSNKVPVYAMPRMKSYLKNSGPWSQLVALSNIELHQLKADSSINLSDNLKVTPFLVPHRGEYSETAGFRIESKNKKLLFIPDIDKWNKWDRDIIKEIEKVDIAFLDATFFKNGEVGNRDMSEIPHPFVEESMKLFNDLSDSEKAKIHFIHFNHTNPILQENSKAREEVIIKGFRIAEEGLVTEL